MLKIPKGKVGVTPIGDSDTAGNLGLIIRPDQAKGRIKQGIVKYVGAEVKSVEIGDYVFFSGYAGILFKLEGEGSLIFLSEDNLIATLSQRTTDITGLYFYGGAGKYFTATYEQAMTLIARSLAKFDVEVKERIDRKPGTTKTKEGKLFLIKNQEHMMGPDCFCMDLAKDFNSGICPKCGSLMHYASSKLWPEPFYHCENVGQCTFNSLGV